jgi:xylulokinase
MSDKSDLVIGIDCSTSGSKAIVWELDGNIVAEGRCDLPLLHPQPFWHEQSAELWWTATVEALRFCVSQVDPRRLAALSISIQRESFVPVNYQGRPLRNAIVWMDERAGALLPEIAQHIPPDRFHQITGKPFSGNLTVGKVAWLKANESDSFDATHKFLDVHSFLTHHLIGEYMTSWGCADPMGLFDMNNQEWSTEILDYLGVSKDQFPSTFPPGTLLGTLTPKAADECNLPGDLLVVAGLGDGQAAGLGINITEPGETYLSLGTGVVSGSFSPNYVTSQAFRTMFGGIPNSYMLETVILGGSYTVNWFMKNFSGLENNDSGQYLSNEEILEAAARKVPPGAQGLLLVPYWNSAMNPYWDANASGIVVGWRGIHQRQHLYRAILEGIALEQRLHTMGVQNALGYQTKKYLAAGGGAQSDLWCQIIADVTAIPVYRTKTYEASSLGAAVLAASGAGLFADVREAADAMSCFDQKPFEPDPDRHRVYKRLFEDVYLHLYPSLQQYLEKLTALTSDSEDQFPTDEY